MSAEETGPRNALFILILTLAGLVIVFFNPVVFQGKTLYFRDLTTFHYPLWQTTADFVGQGEFPLWNPRIHFGSPVAGNPNYLLFYPLAWIRFIMNPLMALHLFIIGHIILGSIAFFLLCVRCKISTVAAFWAALFYAFSGVNLSLTCLLNLVPYIFLIPAILATLEGLLEQGHLRHIGLLGLFSAFLFTVSEPFMIFGLGLLISVRIIVFAYSSKDKALIRSRIIRLAPALVLGITLSAPALLEGMRLLKHTHRYESQNASTKKYTQHPLLSLEMFLPASLDFSYLEDDAAGEKQFFNKKNPYLLSTFLGLGILILGVWIILFQRSSKVFIILGGVIFFIVISWGAYVPWLESVMKCVPMLKWARYSQKFMIFSSGLFIFITALGLDGLFRETDGAKVSKRTAFLLVISGGLALICLVKYLPGFSFRSFLPFSLLSAALTPLMIMWPARRWKIPSTRIHVIGVCIILELLMVNRFAVPFTSRSMLLSTVPVLDYIEKLDGDPSDFRITIMPFPTELQVQRPDAEWIQYHLKNAGYPYFGTIQGIQYAFDLLLDRMNPSWMTEFQDEFYQLNQNDKIRLMQKSGVRYLISIKQYQHPDLEPLAYFPMDRGSIYTLYQLSRSMNRVFFTTDYQGAHIENSPTAMTMILDGPENRVHLQLDEHDDFQASHDSEIGTRHKLHILKTGANFIRAKIQNTSPGILALRDSYFPGWRVHVDGTEKDLKRVDFFFMGVALEPGRHKVEFRYDPPFFGVTLILSVLAGLVVLGLIVAGTLNRTATVTKLRALRRNR